MAGDTTGWITLNIKNVSRNFDVKRDEQDNITVELRVEFGSELSDANPPKARYLKEDFEAIERQAEKRLQDEIVELLIRSQEDLRSDIIHIGRRVRAKDIYKWKDLAWHNVYPKIPINVQVKVKVKGATR